MLWGAFSGTFRSRGLVFSPQEVNDEWKQVFNDAATTSDTVLAHSSPFMHDGAFAHKTKPVQKWLKTLKSLCFNGQVTPLSCGMR